MFNCIYESGISWPSENGACPLDDRSFGGDGSALVDVIDESDTVDVITDAPVEEATIPTWGYVLIAGWLLTMLTGNRRR